MKGGMSGIKICYCAPNVWPHVSCVMALAFLDCERNGDNPTIHSLLEVGISLQVDRAEVDHFFVQIHETLGRIADQTTLEEFWKANEERWNHYLEIQAKGMTAKEAMSALASKLVEWTRTYGEVVWVEMPSSIDHLWLKCFYETYCPAYVEDGWKSVRRPQITHSAICISTIRKLYFGMAGIKDKKYQLEEIEKMRNGLVATHYAIADARSQSQIYYNLIDRIYEMCHKPTHNADKPKESEGIAEDDIWLVMMQTNSKREDAIEALEKNCGDIVAAILSLGG